VNHLYLLNIRPLLDINWQNSWAGAKTSRQTGHFQVSRVSCIGSKDLQLRTRPVPLRDPGPPVHSPPPQYVVNSSLVLLFQNMNRGLHFAAHKSSCLWSAITTQDGSQTEALQFGCSAATVEYSPECHVNQNLDDAYLHGRDFLVLPRLPKVVASSGRYGARHGSNLSLAKTKG